MVEATDLVVVAGGVGMLQRLPCAIAAIGILAAALVLLGEQHESAAQESGLIGNAPKPGAVGIVVWAGGPVDNLAVTLRAEGCEPDALWFNASAAGLVPYVPGTLIAVVNRPFFDEFPGGGLPANGPVLVDCSDVAPAPGMVAPPPQTAPTPLPTATVEPEQSTWPSFERYPEEGAPSPDAVRLVGETSPFSGDAVRAAVRATVSRTATSPDADVVTRIRACVFGPIGEDCWFEPYRDAGMDVLYPVPEEAGVVFLGLQYCNDFACSGVLVMGTLAVRRAESAPDYYVLTSGFIGGAMTGIYALEPELGRVEIRYADGQTFTGTCSGHGRCNSFEFHETRATSVEIAVWSLDGSELDRFTLEIF